MKGCSYWLQSAGHAAQLLIMLPVSDIFLTFVMTTVS